MTTPRLRPMSDTDRPEKIVVFYKATYQLVETMEASGKYKAEPEDYGWCTHEEWDAIFADLLERIKPPEPNPVYWGDEVVCDVSDLDYFYVAPLLRDPRYVWCEFGDRDEVIRLCAVDLTYNGEPITEFCHGKRPDSNEV